MFWEKALNVELHWFWSTIIVFIIGKFILRVGGRKSISQMTITQVIVMIGIGSLLIQPLSGNGLTITILIALIFTSLMIISEFIETKINGFETFSTGKAVLVIENGKPLLNNLNKLRMSLDRLETRLRQSGISSIEDVKYGTIEVSGQLGYELNDNKKPVTKEDYNLLMQEITIIKNHLGITTTATINNNPTNNIFEEINNKKFDSNKSEP